MLCSLEHNFNMYQEVLGKVRTMLAGYMQNKMVLLELMILKRFTVKNLT
jgi:hypothetical protein